MTSETSPLLQNHDNSQAERGPLSTDTVKDAIIVDFDPEGDAEDPMQWPRAYRWGIVGLLAFNAFGVTFTCISVVPIASRIVDDLNHGHPDKSASVLLVTIWELGEAVGPFITAPLSEVLGRYTVFNAANLLFIATVVLAGLSKTMPLFIASRMLTGITVAANVLNPAIVADVFPPEERGTAMSLIMLAPLTGGALGPLISGSIVQTSGWHNVIWMAVALSGASELAFLVFFRETYKVTILKRKAARLRKETGNTLLRTEFDIKAGETSTTKLWESIMRPTVVLLQSGVLQAMSVFGSVAFSYFYIMSTTLPDILEHRYHLQPAQMGSAFICFSVGSGACVVLCNLFLDRIYIKLRDMNGGKGQPEYRLPLVIIGAFSMPFIVALYGWAAQRQVPLPLMLLTIALLGATVLLCFVPLAVYIADAFGIYAASAMTAVIVTRCLAGTFFPLVAVPLIDKLDWGLGFTVLGAISLALAPIPVVIFRYGPKWRQRSSYTKSN